MAIIELRGVSKHFGAKVAVDQVSFSVEEGQCYGLIGPNGAGKTTTFSMLCGFLKPTTGTLSVLGESPSTPGALKGKLGVLPQDAVLPPYWPVGQFLTHLGRLSGLAQPEAEAKKALDRVQLPETWSVACGAMSHGMAKRVALAQAIMGAPQVICLDEPTGGLDPKIAVSVRNIIRELKGAHTVVVSSHNLQELEELCDATALLDRGKLVVAGTMNEMTSQSSEFRVQIAKGEPPLSELQALLGVTDARREASGVLVVSYDSQQVEAEAIITQTVALLAQRGVLLLAVWRGKKLEDKVLQLT